MSRQRARQWARLLVLATIALTTVYLATTALVQMRDPFQSVALWYLVPGAIVVLRRDGDLIGWLLVADGLTWAVHASTEAAGGGGLGWLPVAWLAWMFEWVGYAQWAATVALFVLFPDGLAHRTTAQRRTGRVMIAAAVAVTGAAMLLEPVGNGSFILGVHANPTGLGVLPAVVNTFLIVPVAVAGLGSVVGLWRRSRQVGGPRRRQYTWVLFAFSLVIAGLVIGLLLSGAIGDSAWLPILAGWYLIPTAFSIAILRHRLYDIDRIVSRTVAYAVITVVVAAVYAIPVVALPELFGLRGPLPVAAATLAAAATFSPARRVVQRWVDRRFNRARFDARRELDAFAVRLRSQVDLDTVVAEVQALVDSTLQPRAATTWLRGVRPRA